MKYIITLLSLLFTINISYSQSPPVASNVSAATVKNTNASIHLVASDADFDSLTYSIVSNPSNGTVSLSGDIVTYTPTTNYTGTDTFTFKANDGASDSATKTVTITVISGYKATQTQIGADIDGEAVNDYSGISVSFNEDGTTLAIGAYANDGSASNAGHVRVYSWNGSAWTKLGDDIDGEAANDYFGNSVSLSSDGTTIAIGASQNDNNRGHVRVYSWNGSVWTKLGDDIDGETASDFSGHSVSLSSDGTTVAIGAYQNNGNGTDAGHVRVYSWNGSAWTKQGGDIDGEAAGDYSGYSVSLSSDGTTVAIGAIGNDGTANGAGHVRVYSWNGSTWTQLGGDIDGEAALDSSGSVSLSSDGTTVAIGAYNNDGSASNAGHVRVYSWNGSAWTKLGDDIDGEAANDYFGNSVSLSSDGTTLAIGAYANDGNGNNSGHVRVYSWNGSVWTKLGDDIDGETASDFSGYSVSLSSDGTTVAIGAYGNDGTASIAGHVRVYNLVNDTNSPVAVDDTLTVLEDASLTSKDVIANDTDVDGDTLSLTAVTTAGTGTVAINSDGVSVDYTPAANFNGTEVITYTVSDGTLTDATGTLTITVTAVNDAPVAVDDTLTVLEDASLTSKDVIANDTDVDGDTLSLTAVTTAGTGTVAINSDGVSVDYTPAANFNGTEVITYTVSDGTLTDATGTLTITVTAVNDAPVAVDDTLTVLEDASLTSKDVIANDTDVDGDTLSLTAVTTAGTGTVAINSDGVSVDYTPAANFNGTEVITYTVSDGTLTDATGTLTITVNTNNYTINVTASSSANYTLSGTDFNGAVSGNDPNLTFYVGDQITFAVNASNHPFYIKTVAGTGTGNQASNVTNNGTESGNVVWTPTEAGTYYYQCSAHAGMVGTITIASNSNLSGSVNNDTTWALSGSPYTITGNVLVASGVTLTIEAGVTVKVNSGLYIKNEGVIKAVGNSSDKITFQSSADSPAKSDWEGIRIRSTGGSSIDGSQNYSSGSQFKYVVIKHADIGLYIYDAGLHVSNTEFDTNKYGVEIRKTDGVVIDNSTFTGNDKGIWSEYETFSPNDTTGNILNTFIKNSKFNNNGYGIDLIINQRYFENLNINNNIINENTTGIDFSGGGYGCRVKSVNIFENIIYKNSGYGLQVGQIYGYGGSSEPADTYPLTVEKNIIVNNPVYWNYGGGVSGVTVKIAKNIIYNPSETLDSYSQGLYFTGGTSKNDLITGNLIVSNGASLNLEDSYTDPSNKTFSYNTFIGQPLDNKSTISIYGSGHVFSNNNFTKVNSNYVIKNTSSSTINAENNYWGTSTESEIQAAIYDYSDDFELGAVDYTPFSTAPNPTTPISPPSNVTKSVSGSDVVLNWSANGESDIAGYKLYYGTPTGYSYITTVDLGNVTTYTVTDGDIATEYAITAYDSDKDDDDDVVDGNESWFSISNQVNVTLSSSATSISEPTNSATLTATLDNTSSADVVVNLTYTGTAINATDYSGAASITISAGSLTGTTAITAIDDTDVELTETIIIDMGDVSGGAENGTQQVTISLTDNDLPSVSSITVDKTSIDENGGVAVITATISDVQSKDVTIPLTVTGTSTIDTDYSTSFSSKGASVIAGGNNTGSDLNKTYSPKGVFVDSNGNVFVAEDDNHRVTKWVPGSNEGIIVAGLSYGSGNDGLNSPYDVFVVSDTIYVSDKANNRVMKWNPDASSGTIVAGGNGSGGNLNQTYGPSGIFVDGENNLYVVEAFNHRVTKWAPDSSEGVIVAGGNGSGSDLDQLSNPQGIYVDSSKNIYVAEQGNKRISKWSPGSSEGVLVAGNGGGNALTSLSNSRDVHIDSNGNYFVSQWIPHRIVKWKPSATEGELIGGGTNSGNDVGEFNNIHGIYLDSNNNVYIADTDNHRVQKIQLAPQITIPAGATTGTITFTGIQDSNKEDDETIIITPSTSPTNATSSISDALTVTIVDENFAPVATAQSDLAATEQTEVTITLAGTDPNDDTLTYIIATLPTNGTLSDNGTVITADDLPKTTTSADVVYVSTSDIATSDSFTFKVNDGTVDSESATVSIAITAVNDAPVATAQTDVAATEQTEVTISLAGTDLDNDTLSYIIQTLPTNGSLSTRSFSVLNNHENGFGLPIPFNSSNIPFNGTGGATFELSTDPDDSSNKTGKVINSGADWETAEIILDIPIKIVSGEDNKYSVNIYSPDNAVHAILMKLEQSDDNEYIELSQSFQGAGWNTVTFDMSNVTSQAWPNPGANWDGTADFKKLVFFIDGGSSTPGIYHLDNIIKNSESLSLSSSVITSDDLPKTTTSADVVYISTSDTASSDSFTFKVNDGTVDSEAATVSIAITAVNDVPVATAQTDVAATEQTEVTLTLAGTDAESDALTYIVSTLPTNGTLSDNGTVITADDLPKTTTSADVVYVSTSDTATSDSFTFKVNDGTVDSEAATISLAITAVNDVPVATAQTDVAATEQTAVTVTLAGTDLDNDTLSYVIQTLPTNGTLSDNGTVIIADDLPKTTTSADVVYVSTSDTATSDSFTFKVNDGTVDSEAATVSIAITAVNDVPVATAQTDVAATEQTEVTLTLAGTDAESDAITYIVSSLPTNGTLSDDGTVITADDLPKTTTSADVVYISTSDTAISDSFTFKVNDGTVDSEAATVSLAITAVNDEPTKVNLSSLVIDENAAATEIGTLSTNDLDTNDTFTYELVSGEGDTDNTLFTIDTDKLKNIDAFDFETKSSYSVRIKSTDSGSASVEGVFAITVNNINDIAISSEITSTYCDGSDGTGVITIVTSETNGEVTYSWTGPNDFSSTDQNLSGLESGTYELTVKDDSFEKSIELVVEKTEIYNDLSICYVTSDSEDFTKNRIFLSYQDIYNDKKYEILREGSSAGVYEKIGELNSGETSFLDTSSNSSSSSYSYKVRLLDNCDIFSSESSMHKTILLQSSLATDNSVNLSWTSYEGVSYSTYKIYRRVNNGDFEELTAISSANNSYNDTGADVTQNAYSYYVSIAVESCTTTQKTGLKENLSNNFRYTSRVNETTEIKSNQKFIQDDNADYDNDGVLNSVDICPDSPEGITVDVNGCPVFTLPLDNNKVSVISASCIGNTDGSIGISVEDDSYNYTVTVTGQDDPITLGGETKTASVTGLGTGTYTVCFKVDGQDAYEQCFEVNIGEPKALSAFIDVDNDNKTTSIQLSGSSSYNVEVNGQRYDVKGDRFTTNLPSGLSIIKISTDLDCQGIIEREVFISEDIHYYPNPTQTDVNVHVSGEDTMVQVSVFSEKGDLIYTREQQIQDFSRKTNIDLSRQITGTYIVVMDGPTVRKTFKIVKR